MDDFLYVAAAGAREALLGQAINSNNLANVSTTGFRADLAIAQSTYLGGAGSASRVVPGVQESAVDFGQGVINNTGRDLDVAVSGEGWITVTNSEGVEGYTRRGDLHVTDSGQLLNGAGQPIVGSSGPIALPPFSSISIGTDGTVSIVALGEDPNTLTAVDRIKLVTVDESKLAKGSDGILVLPEGEEADEGAAVSLLSGSIESSNVNSVEAMVRMIELARQFESYVKIMGTAEELDQSSAELMRLS